MIVVDDCSEEPFDVSGYTINYIKNKTNLGPGVSRNKGLENSKGEYVVFLDSDDYWDENFLNMMVSSIEKNTEVIMAYCNGYNIDTNSHKIEKRSTGAHNPNVIIPDLLIYGRPWVTGSCIWVADKIKDSRWLDSRVWEDYAFDIDQAIMCNKVLKVEDYLIYYEISGEDKLSLREPTKIMVDKNTSLYHIAESIKNSEFYYDHRTRKSIIRLLLSNTIDLLRLHINEDNCYKNNFASIRYFHSKILAWFTGICVKLPSKFGLFLLRRTRKILSFD